MNVLKPLVNKVQISYVKFAFSLTSSVSNKEFTRIRQSVRSIDGLIVRPFILKVDL